MNQLDIEYSVEDNPLIRAEERKRNIEEFDELCHELDSDVWVVSVGFVFVEMVLYGLIGKWTPLQDDMTHESSKSVASSVSTLVGIVLVSMLLFTSIASRVQTSRDRIMLSDINSKTTHKVISISMQFKEFGESVTYFIAGFLAWTFGWGVMYRIRYTDEIDVQIIGAFGAILYAVIVVTIHTRLYRKKFIKWLNKNTSSTVNIKSKKLSNELENAINDITSGELSYSQHRKIYSNILWGYFWHTSCSLLIALPWESLIDSILEYIKEYWFYGIIIVILIMYFTFVGSRFAKNGIPIENKSILHHWHIILSNFHDHITTKWLNNK